MKYIIMCGGTYPYWTEPRQLIKVFGEPLVVRTIRLLREAGVDDIAISATDERFNGLGVPVLKHDNPYNVSDHNTLWIDAFYPMDKPVCYLYGDVFYSPAAIRTIVDMPVIDVEFFASAWPYTEYYIKPWAEPFAFKVIDTAYFRRCIEVAKDFKNRGIFHRLISWELWQVIRKTTPGEITNNYCVINDYTCDIDEPSDVELLERVLSDHNI